MRDFDDEDDEDRCARATRLGSCAASDCACSCDDWEEVHGEEAEAALAQLAKRSGARTQKREEPVAEVDGAAASDADMQDVDAEGAPYVALAGNGVELVRACSLSLARETGAKA